MASMRQFFVDELLKESEDNFGKECRSHQLQSASCLPHRKCSHSFKNKVKK
jgi:hypothetical protein